MADGRSAGYTIVMFEFIDQLDRMGPKGAPIALAIGGLLGFFALAMIGYSFSASPETSRWTLLVLRTGGGFIVALAALFVLLGFRHRSGPRYPDPSETFPSLPVDEFKNAMYDADRPLVACSACRIHLPAHFSTGACPACSSSLNWTRVETDEDADLICSAVHD